MLTIVAIALQVFLALFIVGLSSGVVREWGKRVEGVGADLFVQPPNASIFFAFSRAVMENPRLTGCSSCRMSLRSPRYWW